MPTDSEFTRLEQAADAYREDRARLDESTEALYGLIRAAAAHGDLTRREIADAAGLSVPRIDQILHPERARRRPR